MQNLNFPFSLISLLTQFDGASTEGMPTGCVLVNKGYRFGLFSLEKGALVLPVEYAHPRSLKSGLFQISSLSGGGNPQQSGIFSFERGEFVLPMHEWKLDFSLDHAYVYTQDYSQPRICGIYATQKNEWVLSCKNGYVFGKIADYYSEKRYVFDGEELVLVRLGSASEDVLGLFSTTRGFVFGVAYSEIHVHVSESMLIATAVRLGKKECFVLRDGLVWKTPPADNVREIVPPFFVLEESEPHLGGHCLYDAGRTAWHLTGCRNIFRHKNTYVGVGLGGMSTTIYDIDTNSLYSVKGVALSTPLDDDRWVCNSGAGFGVYSLNADAIIIPPVFEYLAHITGHLFFARWQGESRIIDVSEGEVTLTLKLGAPARPSPPAGPMPFWTEIMPEVFVAQNGVFDAELAKSKPTSN